MQEIDRDFLYYGILNYKWVNEDEIFCIVIKNGSIEFKTPEGGEHKTYYRIGADKRSCTAEMGSFAQSMMGMGEIFEKCHEGELFRLNCSDKYIGDNEGKKIYKIDRIWYGNGRLHGDFTEIEREKKIYIDFDYEGKRKIIILRKMMKIHGTAFGAEKKTAENSVRTAERRKCHGSDMSL